MKNSSVNFPRANDLLLNTDDTGSGRLLTARPSGHAGLIDGHRIGNLFGFPKLIFLGKLGITTLLLEDGLALQGCSHLMNMWTI